MENDPARWLNRTIEDSETTMQPKLPCKVFGIEPRRLALAAICLSLAWLNLGQTAQAANEQKAGQDVGRAARLYIGKSSIATAEMQITKPDFQRTITMQFWSLGESKILVRIRQPAEDAGTAILKVGGKTWYYLPKANRTVEMPAAMMMTSGMGGDFTLNDLIAPNSLTDDYVVAPSFEASRDG